MDQGTGPSGGRKSDEWAVVATRLRKVYDTGKVKVDALKDVDLREIGRASCRERVYVLV